MPPRKPPPTETARVLRRLRDTAGLSAADAAKQASERSRLNLTQSTVSRAEMGRIVPSKAQLDALCDVYGASAEDRAWLHAHSREVDAEYRRVAAYRPRAARLQREYGELEAESTRVTTFSPTVVPGLLQTEGYMTAMGGRSLAGGQLEDWLASRRERQAILRQPGRTFEQIVYEGALRWGLGGPAVMVEQIDHLVSLSERSNVELGVLSFPDDAPTYLLNSFDMYEREGQPLRVIVGTHGSVLIHDDAEDTAIYVDLLEQLRALAAWGDAARAALADVRRSYS